MTIDVIVWCCYWNWFTSTVINAQKNQVKSKIQDLICIESISRLIIAFPAKLNGAADVPGSNYKKKTIFHQVPVHGRS